MTCNVTRMKEHLKNRTAYLEDPTNEASWIVEEHNRKRQKTGIQTFVSVAGVKRQSKLEVPAMSSQEQEIIHRMAAMALYKTGGAFSSFDDEDYAAFIHRLNPAYKLPSARLFSGRLLNEVYDDVRGQLQMVLDKCTYFNLDGSANMRRDRIVNLSVHTEMGIFQLESAVIPSIKHTAEKLAKWADEKATFWSRGALKKT